MVYSSFLSKRSHIKSTKYEEGELKMIAEIIDWLILQTDWVEPIFQVIVVFACIKYLVFDW